MNNMEMIPIRIFFKKLGRAKYISHLDINRCFQRAFKRSGLPVWYTQGFNPHLYLTFTLPLSLGFESDCESMDLRLTEECGADEVIARLNAVLPEGLCAVQMAEPVMKPEKIAWADYRIEVEYDTVPLEKAQADFEKFCAQEQIMVSKKTKKGICDVDVKTFFSLLSLQKAETSLLLDTRFASGINLNINPTLLLKSFAEEAGYPYNAAHVRKTQVLTGSFEKFQ